MVFSYSEDASAPSQEAIEDAKPLSLSWVFGFNKDLVKGVHSLKANDRQGIFYSASHTGIIYDQVQKTQLLLQGHCNPISATCVSMDKMLVVTADKGPDSLLAEPLKTVLSPHTAGIVAVDMSNDGSLLSVLSAADNEGQQEISIWDLKAESMEELFRHNCPVGDIQYQIRFNESRKEEFVTTGTKKLVFWWWDGSELDYSIPVLSREDYANTGTSIGEFLYSIYLPRLNYAVTSTRTGSIILWDSSVEDEMLESKASNSQTHFQERGLVKIIELSHGSGIPFLECHNNLLVSCSSDGSVRFYDLDFRIVAWYEDINAGPVLSLSFEDSEDPYYVSPHILGDRSNKKGTFQINDFVVATSSAQIIKIHSDIFEDPTDENRKGKNLLQGFDQKINCVATHPSETCIVVSMDSGVFQAWDYLEKSPIVMKQVSQTNKPLSISFSPDGKVLAAGFSHGYLKLLRWSETKDLAEVASFRVDPTVSYERVHFSPDTLFLATSDSKNHLSLFRFLPEEAKPIDSQSNEEITGKGTKKNKIDPSDGSENRNGWAYIGRYHSHTKKIVDISFAMGLDGNLQLISAGEDSRIVTYDLETSCIVDGIQLKYEPIIATEQKLTSCLVYPRLKDAKEDLILTANSEFKLKIWSGIESACRQTVLGPTFGKPISKLVVVPTSNEERPLLAYATNEKVVGLIKLPLTGVPYEAMGLIAHPGKISSLTVTNDGSYIVTAGLDDLIINVWKVDGSTLESRATEEDSFVSLLEGGKDGHIYKEIVNLFHYSQIRESAIRNASPHKVEGKIKISEVPNILRALGYYPTNEEIKNIYRELQYAGYAHTGKVATHISLVEFIRTYMNHKPVFKIDRSQVDKAFQTVLMNVKEGRLTWPVLQEILQKNGESISPSEMETLISALLGKEGAKALLDQSTANITSTEFIGEILGMSPDEMESKL